MGMTTNESRGKSVSLITILGIVVLVIGLGIAVVYGSYVYNDFGYGGEVYVMRDIAYIGLAMAIEFFGIGLIILGKNNIAQKS